MEEQEFTDYEGRKIVAASTEYVDKNASKMAKLLQMIGHPEAWVSDESDLGDFMLDTWELEQLCNKLGFKVSDGDRLLDIVRKM